MSRDTLKQAAAEAALDHILPQLDSNTVIGVGTGSTADFFIDALARVKNRFDGAVASSQASAARLRALGIRVHDLNVIDSLPFYVDGADESNDQLQLIKGGGAALTGEKIVAAVAEEFICIADESKLVNVLGAFPLPVEVIGAARSHVARQLVKLGGTPVWRSGVVTDNGHVIVDVRGLSITDPVALEQAINQIAGVVSCGLFARRPADRLLLARSSGVQEFNRKAL